MLLSAPAPAVVSHDEWKTTTEALEADTEDNLRELQQRVDGSQVRKRVRMWVGQIPPHKLLHSLNHKQCLFDRSYKRLVSQDDALALIGLLMGFFPTQQPNIFTAITLAKSHRPHEIGQSYAVIRFAG